MATIAMVRGALRVYTQINTYVAHYAHNHLCNHFVYTRNHSAICYHVLLCLERKGIVINTEFSCAHDTEDDNVDRVDCRCYG